jgi:hypothetical protein
LGDLRSKKLLYSLASIREAYSSKVGGELVHAIVAWAGDMGRSVTIMPANDELEEYYKSLGYMVSHGSLICSKKQQKKIDICLLI